MGLFFTYLLECSILLIYFIIIIEDLLYMINNKYRIGSIICDRWNYNNNRIGMIIKLIDSNMLWFYWPNNKETEYMSCVVFEIMLKSKIFNILSY